MVAELMSAVLSINPAMREEAVAIMVNYKLASLVGNLRIKVRYKKTMADAPVNFYGILFMKSGAGKNSSLNILDHWYFQDIKNSFKKLYHRKRQDYIEGLSAFETEDRAKELIKELSNWEMTIASATKEGIEKMASTLYKLECLTLGVEIDELDKYIVSEAPLINMMFGSYDEGRWNPKATAGRDLQEAITGVAPNFFGFATPEAMLLDDSVAEPFKKMLASGFARRAFYYHEDSDVLPKILTAEDLLKLEDISCDLKEKSKGLSDKLMSLVKQSNLGKVITFSKKSKMFLTDYKVKSLELASITNDSIMNAEYRERDFKTAKLAAMYAFLDGRDEVTNKDIEYAITITEHSSASLARIGEAKSLIEKLYLRIREEDGYVHISDMLSFGLVNKNHTQRIKEYVRELEPYSEMYGDIFETMDNGKGDVMAVRITQLITAHPESCIFSASISRNGKYNHEDGYKKAELDFHDIPQWMTSEKNLCYSSVAFKHGKRDNASTEAYSNLIILDIDEGMSLDYAKEIFKDYYSIITVTRNHQKEKHGVICDRFRVVLLADKYLFTTPDIYKGLMHNIQRYYNCKVDTACFDKAHIYYSNPSEVWMGECNKKFEVSMLIPRADDNGKKKQASQSFMPESGKALKLYFEQTVKEACNHGTGIINKLRDAMFATTDTLASEFKTLEEAEEWITDLSEMASDDYWDRHDLDNEILNKLRIKWEERR